MGTHPIFESDFDCLTDMNEGAGRHLANEDYSIPYHTPIRPSDFRQETTPFERQLISNRRHLRNVENTPSFLQKNCQSPADKLCRDKMKRLKLFSTPKPNHNDAKNVSFADENNLDIQIQTTKAPKLNFSIISSEDEFISCDEMTKSKENIANVSLSDYQTFENASNIEQVKATERLSNILNSLSVSSFTEYDNRIKILENENLHLKKQILDYNQNLVSDTSKSQEAKKLEKQVDKLRSKEIKYRNQINLLIERVEFLNEHNKDLKGQAKRYKTDRDIYKNQLTIYREEKVKLEQNVWDLESQLDEELFKRDKVELKVDQLRREIKDK